MVIVQTNAYSKDMCAEKMTLDKRSIITKMLSLKTAIRWRIIDIVVMAVMGALLYYGVAAQLVRIYSDVAKYECYAVAFWHGMPALQTLPATQCDFITHPTVAFLSNHALAIWMQQHHLPTLLVQFVANQHVTQAFHVLPHEYPFLALAPFSLVLLVPSIGYQTAFALLMIAVAILMYAALAHFRSRTAALACVFYLVVGGWGTAAARFDLIPSFLTLLALVYAVRKNWHWAFAYLALGTLFKFYPVILLPTFLLAQQLTIRGRWLTWRRVAPLVTFILICAGVTLVSLRLSVEGTLGAFSYFQNRPFQIESLSASFLWLLSLRGFALHPVFSYGSLNVLSVFSAPVALLGTASLVVCLAYVYWLQWRGKIDIAAASLLILLVVMVTGKVFSPQYLIWVAPLVAYVGQANIKWLCSWGAVSALTTWIYPYLYFVAGGITRVPYVPLFYPVVAVRNVLFLFFVVVLLVYFARHRPNIQAPSVRGEITPLSPVLAGK